MRGIKYIIYGVLIVSGTVALHLTVGFNIILKEHYLLMFLLAWILVNQIIDSRNKNIKIEKEVE